MEHDREQQSSAINNSTTVYMVSVYLLLIAFFVILHTVSKKEDVKAAAVVGSLRVTFQRPDGRTEDLPQNSGEPQFSGPNQEFRDHVIGLFGSFINSSRFSQAEGGNVLRIAMQPEEIFYAGTSSLRADRIDVMRGLADMITNPQPYRRNSIDITLERPGRGGDDAGKLLVVRRAGVIARDLVKDQVDPKQISIGITEGRRERIFLTFTVAQSQAPVEESAGGGE